MKMASSSSPNCGIYDVFLSFRGETRRNLTDYLARTLENHGFNVFLDENKLNRGEPITLALKQAIKDSRLAAIIFSKGYAESRWCLEELVEIFACKETMGQMVLPIFYDIDPTDVSHQTSDFEEAFRKHQERFSAEWVQKCRDALVEAAELAGEALSSTAGYEGIFVQQIVYEIARKLKNRSLAEPTYPVGIDSRVQQIGKCLDVGGSDKVLIIGIWGMGGLGKTPVANAIFNKYQDKFAGKSFLANVREEKLVDSQNTLLDDVLRLRNVKVSKVDEGTEDIKRRLGNLRVLVIVDGVDSVKQLEALAIKHDSFGPGSRIIVTTRDKHLLDILKADTIHPLPAMNKDEALELLSWHAFGKNYPDNEYLQVSREVVDYCEGLPKALYDLGLHLLKRSTSQWQSALENWKRSRPYSNIYQNLRISYDGIEDGDVKSMFLDVSCFFIGMNKDYVMKILNRHDFDTTRLYEQCLVTFDTEGNLMMHGLIRDTGREIVRKDSLNIKGKRCRLWDREDVIHVLKTKTGKEEIQGLTLDLSGLQKPSFSTEAFKQMHGLRLLQLKGVKFTGPYEDLSNHLSKKLSWLCWPEFPMQRIRSDFDETYLVDLDLSHSNIQVWEDSVSLEKLKILNLGYCNSLEKSPDFSQIPNLERLILEHCKNLQAISTLPKNLEILEADECIALQEMPNFSKMSRMRELHLNHSPELTEISGLHKSLNSMTRIHMEGCTNLTAEFRKNILQGWTSCGYGGIFLNGSCIPEWFEHVRDDEVCFEVPQRVGSNFKGLTLCCVYSANKQPKDCPLVISVRNKTKRTALLAHITYASVPTSCDSEDHYLWQGQLSNDVLSWQDGDEVKIFVRPVRPGDNSARVKKIAVDLVWDKFMKENMVSRPGLYDLNSGDNDEARTSHGASNENPPTKILSDSVGGGDDKAGASLDASDENPPSKILSDSVGGGDDKAGASHDASDENPPSKILSDSVGGGDDKAGASLDASDENPPSKILSDSVGGGDDKAGASHDASDENPPSKILSDSVRGGDDKAGASHDASDENPPSKILSDNVGGGDDKAGVSDSMGGGDDKAGASHDASDENPPSKILSDSVGGGDDKAGASHDASDENPPSKILSNSVGGGDDKAGVSDNVGGGDDKAGASHDASDENPPSKILSDSVGGGDDKAGASHDASDENPLSKILSDSVGGGDDKAGVSDSVGGGDDKARASHDASDENPPSKILSNNVGGGDDKAGVSDSVGGGDDKAGASNDASDENPPSKILSDSVGGGDDKAGASHDASDENPPLKILSNSVGGGDDKAGMSDNVGGGDDKVGASHDASDENPPSKILSDSVGGGDDKAGASHDASDENPFSKILSDSVGGGDDKAGVSDSVGGGDDKAGASHDASDENPPSKILSDSVRGGDDKAGASHDASDENPPSKILSDSVGGGDDKAGASNDASDENPPSKILSDSVGGGDDKAGASHDASDENPPSKILFDSVCGGDDKAGASHDASDENQTPKRGLLSFFSKLLPSCGKKTR